jgi:hypothetical protein
MKKIIASFAILIAVIIAPVTPIVSVASAAPPPGRPMRVVLARQSNVDPVQIVKHFSSQCPNVTITTNPKGSDFMLAANGWSGDYRFLVIAHGGDTIYATQTALLSNSVKDVCKFLSTR